MARPVMPDYVWAGTDASLNEYHAREEMIESRLAAGWSQASACDPADDNEEEVPYLFSKQGNIGVVSINGALTNKDAWYNELLGIASYNAIRDAVIYAAMDAEVEHILLMINSGGGAVNGVSDCGDLIRMVNDKVKPVTAFTDGSMCSAAYWLGVSAGEVYSTNVSTVGSIGVIATHMEYSKQLKEDGVGVTVFRGGKFKALINSVEPLTAEAKAMFQAQIDAAERVFVSYVADMRSRTYDYTYEHMAQGREFFGEQALSAGLVDGITNFDKLISNIQQSIAAKQVDNKSTFANTSRNSQLGASTDMTKEALTAQQIAALAAGAAVSAATAAAATTEQVAATTEQVAAAATQQVAAATTEQVAAAASAQAPALTASQAQATVVDYLTAQVKEKDASLLAANVELDKLKAKIADLEAASAGLLEIAAKSANNMRIALNHSAADFSGMAALTLVAEHKRLEGDFVNKFKAGGVAAVDAAAASEDAKGATLDPFTQARLNAVRPTAEAK